MKIIDRAKSHFESLGVQSIEVKNGKIEKGNQQLYIATNHTYRKEKIV